MADADDAADRDLPFAFKKGEAAPACSGAGTGLTEWFYRARTRCHRLSRAGEDALLPVVTGAVV